MKGVDAVAWISVHYVPTVRVWAEEDIEVLYEAGRVTCGLLRENGWADLMVN
jgi:hypothetical protein